MALKFKIDSLDGLEDGLKQFYSKGDDGKFTLLLEDDPAKATMSKLRQQLEEKERALREKDKAEADAKLAKEREDMEKKGEWEKLSATMGSKVSSLEKDLAEARLTHETHLKESLALSYLAPVAANPRTLEALKREYVGGLEVVQGKVVVKSDPAKTPEQFAKDMVSNPEYAPFLKAVNSSGGGANTNSGNAPKNNPNSNMSPVERLKAHYRGSV